MGLVKIEFGINLGWESRLLKKSNEYINLKSILFSKLIAY